MVSRHARLVRAVLLAVSLGGCLVVDDRLYACAEEGQCERGTACVEGLCVPLSRDGGAAPDAGEAADAGHDVDGGMPNGGAADGGEGDAGLFPDGGTDGGDPAADAGVQDAGAQDAGVEDAGVQDAGAGTPDGGVPADAGSGEDGGAAPDGGAEPDAGQPADAGTALDGGMPPSPPGDLCTQAVELQLDPQSGSATAQGTLAGSGSEHPLCGGSGPDLFYAVSARGSLTATAAALDGGAVDVAVLGSCPTGPVATCPSSGSSSNSTAARYLVAVTSVGSDAEDFELILNGQPPSAGDSCAQPLVLSPLQHMGKSSSVTSSFSGITQGYTELANPCGGMFSGPARRDLVFQVNVQAAGLLVVTVDPSLSSGSASADVGYGVTTGSSCAGATPVGVCVNAAGVMGVESGPAIPVNAGTYFIWVSVASVSTGPLTRVEVTARLQ